MKIFKAYRKFIENLACIILREIDNPYIDLWGNIMHFFDKVRFSDYNDSNKAETRDELAKEVLCILDLCIEVLEDNFTIEELINLFNYTANVLDYGTKSEIPENTAYEIGYNQAILDFNLLNDGK